MSKLTRNKIGCLMAAAVAVSAAAIFAAEPFIPVFITNGKMVTPAIFPELSVFRESIPSYPVNSNVDIKRFTPLSKAHKYPEEYVRRLSDEERRLTPYRFEEMFEDPANTIDSEYARSGKPFFVYERISRPPYFLPRDGAPLAIRASFEEWKKKHPGFLGFNSLWELDSDSTYFQRFYNRMKDPSIEAELHAAFGPPDEKGMAHRRRWAEKVFKIAEDFHFGEKRIFPLCSNFPGYEHIFGALGAAGIWYEATSQGYGAWNTAGAFVRGAARQRGLDFGWYMAQYYPGYDRQGNRRIGDSRRHISHDGSDAKELRPYRGESRSLHKRQMLYGWLIGAKYLQTEGWPQFYADKVDGKIVPTENALDFEEAYQRAKRIERGETFTTLAVLTPLDEPMASIYTNKNMIEPEVQKDIFDTLVPIRGDSGEDLPKRKIGEQGCLFNSEFGGFFDVLCPDSGQDSAAFAQALSRYRHVLIAGHAFNKDKFDSAALAAFEKSGGKVHRYPSPECPTKDKLRELLLKIQDETMPVSVAGDIQWGVNKTSKGWLVWLVNNKGVVKFSDEPEEFRPERTAHVVVTVKATGEKFEADVAPGDFKLWETGKSTFALKEVAGVPRIAVDGVPCVGMCALPEPRLGPAEATFSMTDFSALGVKFFSDIWWAKGPHNDWWLGEGRYDFEAFDRRAKGLLDASPDGWIFPRLKMDPPDWWIKAHPNEIRANEARPESEAWRALYRRMLEDVVRHVEASPYANRVMGYHVGALHGSEWLVWPWPHEEEPPVAWDARDPLPPLAATTARRAYIRKRNKDVADALLDAAAIVKRLTGRKKLVGAFFGYMGNADHEDSSRVMRSPDIDFLASPGAYDHRRAGQSGRFQLAWPASCRLHGKLYWDESDIRTYHAKTKAVYRCATPEESVGAIKRNLGYALCGGWEVWWFLLAGNRTFHDEQMLAPIRVALAEERATFASAQWKPADVAVFTSPDEYATSLLSVKHGIPVRAYCKIDFHFRTMPFTGVAYDSYDLADIGDPRLPDYKVYVFPNAFTLSEAQRETIKQKVRRAGKTAIWLYAPGYYRNGEGAAVHIEELTGVRVKESYPVAEGRISRTFAAEGDGTCATNGWRSTYLSVPTTVGALRKALVDAGAHVWTDTLEVIAAGRGYLMVHAATDGRKTIRLPSRSDVSEIYGTCAPLKDVASFEDSFCKGETKIYRIRELVSR